MISVHLTKTHLFYLQISQIQVHSCPDLVLAVDLESMNPGVQVLEVKNSQSVRIESVKFDPRFENKQRLRMIFTNVVSSTLANLEVTETVQVMLHVIFSRNRNLVVKYLSV